MVLSAPSDGAETSTRLAPFSRWILALSLSVKMPVHSITMSTCAQGRSAGFLIAVTWIGPRPASMVVSVVVTVPGKRPCTRSKRNRWALVSTGPRSLIATTSISVRPDSMIARSTLRPIRPKPLIATLTVMMLSFVAHARIRRIGRTNLRGAKITALRNLQAVRRDLSARTSDIPRGPSVFDQEQRGPGHAGRLGRTRLARRSGRRG